MHFSFLFGMGKAKFLHISLPNPLLKLFYTQEGKGVVSVTLQKQ